MVAFYNTQIVSDFLIILLRNANMNPLKIYAILHVYTNSPVTVEEKEGLFVFILSRDR